MMKPEIDEGMFAFPWKSEEFGYMCRGMELRDYFAAAALTGIMASNVETPEKDSDKIIARAAYILAEAMLLERQK